MAVGQVAVGLVGVGLMAVGQVSATPEKLWNPVHYNYSFKIQSISK